MSNAVKSYLLIMSMFLFGSVFTPNYSVAAASSKEVKEQILPGAGIQIDEGGVTIEIYAVEIRTQEELDAAAKSIAHQISKWVTEVPAKDTQFDTAYLAEPTDGLYPRPTEVTGISSEKMISQITEQLKAVSIVPEHQSELKLTSKFNILKRIHKKQPSWVYDVVRVKGNYDFQLIGLLANGLDLTTGLAGALSVVAPSYAFAKLDKQNSDMLKWRFYETRAFVDFKDGIKENLIEKLGEEKTEKLNELLEQKYVAKTVVGTGKAINWAHGKATWWLSELVFGGIIHKSYTTIMQWLNHAYDELQWLGWDGLMANGLYATLSQGVYQDFIDVYEEYLILKAKASKRTTEKSLEDVVLTKKDMEGVEAERKLIGIPGSWFSVAAFTLKNARLGPHMEAVSWGMFIALSSAGFYLKDKYKKKMSELLEVENTRVVKACTLRLEGNFSWKNPNPFVADENFDLENDSNIKELNELTGFSTNPSEH